MAIVFHFVLATLLWGSLTGILSYIVYNSNWNSLGGIPNTVQTYHTFPLRYCTAAQDDYIRNFQVVNQNSTHITFSWDIVDGYYNSSYINYFRLYYQHRSSTPSLYIRYSSATRNGATFRYTRSVRTFNNGPYIMWVRVYRSSALDPRYTYSRRQYVDTGK